MPSNEPEAMPTIDELRDLWVDWNLDPLPRSVGIKLVPPYQEAFDRMLREHDAEVIERYADTFEYQGGRARDAREYAARIRRGED